MACGLPVVCHRSGGYTTSIEHGKNGFLFDSSDEALALVRQLKDDPGLRAMIAASARQTLEAMYSPAERAKVIQYYLQ
jgi:glycosyltransferase involved in cell wall biosynthesis